MYVDMRDGGATLMTPRDNALALYDLMLAYRGKMELQEAQHRLRLTDEEMGEAIGVIRRAFRETERKFPEPDQPDFTLIH